MRALALLLVVLGADGGVPLVAFSDDLDLGDPSSGCARYSDGEVDLVCRGRTIGRVRAGRFSSWADCAALLAANGATVSKTDGGAWTCRPNHEHCWHHSPLVHTVPNHRDDFCCHCGAERCVSVSRMDDCDGHGPRCAQPQLDLKRPRMP